MRKSHKPASDTNMDFVWYSLDWIFLVLAQMVKNPPACRRPEIDPSVRKIPWRR